MNKTGLKVFLALFLAVSLFVWQVTIVLGGSSDSDQYKNRVVNQLGEIKWLNQIDHLMPFKSSAYRNIQANSLSYAKAVILRMTDRFNQSGGDISAINLAMEDGSKLLQEGRDLIAPRTVELSIENVTAAYYGSDDMQALAALLDFYSLILLEADQYNAAAGSRPSPVYLVPVASGNGRLLSGANLHLVELPKRIQVEEEFLQERDRAKKEGALNYEQRINQLSHNSLYQVLHAIKIQEKTLLAAPLE